MLALLGQIEPVTTGVPVGTGLDTPTVDWWALAPMITLALGGVLLLTVTSLVKGRLPRHFYAGWTILTALVASAFAENLWIRVQGWDRQVPGWNPDTDVPGAFSTVGGAIGIDGFGLIVTLIICSAVVLVAMLADDYLRAEDIDGPEFYVLVLLAAAGGVVMTSANDLIVLFLGLETLSMAIYVLAAIHRRRLQSQEAGLKYFILGSFSSAFLLYGIAFVYGATGTTSIIGIRDFLAGNVLEPITSEIGAFDSVTLDSPLLLVGIAFMLVGLGFKVAAVPFHTWSPDVYDGSPSPVAGFMAAAVKAAAVGAIVRVLILGFGTYQSDWGTVVAALAALSMIVGSVLAIVQTNVKRMLAYSSIAHVGFILMALQGGTDQGVSAALYYLIAYDFLIIGSFAVTTVVGRVRGHPQTLTEYHGLGRANPLLALAFTLFLLSQAGVPFTTGFVAKFYAIGAAVDVEEYWLALVAMLSAVVSAFLYLRIVAAMWMRGEELADDEPVPAQERVRVPVLAAITLAVCALFTVANGVFPDDLTQISDDSTAALVQVADESPTEVDLSALTPGG
jgi:NADH-quinone oxidoreductase subunit N